QYNDNENHYQLLDGDMKRDYINESKLYRTQLKKSGGTPYETIGQRKHETTVLKIYEQPEIPDVEHSR
ncbi:hypothetical protein ACYEXS_35020, partial [Paenibacillus sp. MAH-36]|uniref:hypothetical protein n=1 Tax=Paenibacillus sp. GCM10012304 TaxID=3317341 RepID=UPI00360C9E97